VATYTQADSLTIESRYPGLTGNRIAISISPSSAEPGKKELEVKGIITTEKYSFATVEELLKKTDQSIYIRVKKIGDQPVEDVALTALTGGTSGMGNLQPKDFTSLFLAIDGANFDVLYLPSDDPAIQAVAKQYILDREKFTRKRSTLVIGGKADQDTRMDTHIERSIASNSRRIVNCAIAGTHNNGKTYGSLEWAAWLAGMIAATPAHISLTAQLVPMKRAAKDWGHT
ncbi:phage tail protein, partial [Brevibacillus laterosporus]|nr:phage tail protein [Brevibacillus laterosporus]